MNFLTGLLLMLTSYILNLIKNTKALTPSSCSDRLCKLGRDNMRGETFRLSSTWTCFGLEQAPRFITFEI